MIGASLAMSSRRRTSSSLARSEAVGAASSLTVGAAAVQPLERALDLAGRHHALLDRASEQVADGVDRLAVEGIGRGHHQRVALLGDRNDAVAHQEAELQAIGEQRHVRQVLGVGQRQRPGTRPAAAPCPPPAPGRAGSAPDRSARRTAVALAAPGARPARRAFPAAAGRRQAASTKASLRGSMPADRAAEAWLVMGPCKVTTSVKTTSNSNTIGHIGERRVCRPHGEDVGRDATPEES